MRVNGILVVFFLLLYTCLSQTDLIETILVPSAECEFFSEAIDISGNTLITECTTTLGEDKVAIFVQVGSIWAEQQVISNPLSEYAEFGSTVAVDGHYAVIGAPFQEFAFVYKRTGTTWSLMQKLNASQGSTAFGTCVDIDGDYIAVGAPLSNSQQGLAYVFHKSDGETWTEQAVLVDPVGQSSDQFGYSVSISGDLIAVGANIDSSAHVFERNGESWPHLQSMRKVSCTFGISISLDGNVLVVGAGSFDDVSRSLNDVGTGFVYEKNGATFSEVTQLRNGTYEGEKCGWINQIYVKGELIIMGCYYNNDPDTRAGKSYVYERDANGNWNETYTLQGSDIVGNDFFGKGVAISSDYMACQAKSNKKKLYIFSKSASTVNSVVGNVLFVLLLVVFLM